jgi:diguanylate cyclase (GGDEF)-like protein
VAVVQVFVQDDATTYHAAKVLLRCNLKDRVSRFLSTDRGIIALLIAMVLGVVLVGMVLSRVVSDKMLRDDAESTSVSWTDSLTQQVDILSIMAGMTPSGTATHLLQNATQVGDVYRYAIWNSAGNRVFLSERMKSPVASTTFLERQQKQIANAVVAGSNHIEAGVGKSLENPDYFVETYIPIKKDGVVVGVLDVYLDHTDDHALYRRSFLLTEGIIALAVLFAGGLPGFLVYRKMQDHRVARAEAVFLADHDSLTGIPNRKRLGETAKSALGWTSRNNSHVAALLVDMDRFKEINDTFGHGTGDKVLQEFAVRLGSAIRVEDMVARLGGDEFVVLQVGMAQPSGATSLANRLMKILSEPYDIGDLQVACRASIGVAIAPTDAQDWDQLLTCADAALYKAKAEGRDSVCFFEAGMDAIFRERRRLETDLRRALATNSFQLAYQPLFSFHDGSLLGFEALLRWPDGWGSESPATFIPIAEECGLIVPIGAWALEAACRTAAAWTKPLRIAVNLSPVQFRHGDIVAVIEAALRASGLDPVRLELEVTESLWLQNSDAVLDQLTRIRALGIPIALDDFGTGYSSLAYLWKFPFDTVKIDRSFVMEMESDPKAAAIVNTVVALGKTLNLTVTAEGVETTSQAQALSDSGCDQAQGYLFGRPLSLTAANNLANGDSASVVEAPSSVPHSEDALQVASLV